MARVKLVRSIAAVLAFAAVTTVAAAADQKFVATGDLSSSAQYSYLEVWGKSSPTQYANPASDPGDTYQNLVTGDIDGPGQTEVASVSVKFGYDPAAPVVDTSPSGRTHYFSASPMQFTASLTDGTSIELNSFGQRIAISVNSQRSSQNVYFWAQKSTADGPLPGSTLELYPASAYAGAYTVDLVDFLGPSSYYSSGFDLSGFGHLPVRLTTPSVFRPVLFTVELSRSGAAGTFQPSPPDSLQALTFNQRYVIGAYLDGVFGLAVNRADYTSDSDYLVASNWVNANIAQVNVESMSTWNIATLTPVPEPDVAALLSIGLSLMTLLARRRTHNA